jgi:hypothetical protein
VAKDQRPLRGKERESQALNHRDDMDAFADIRIAIAMCHLVGRHDVAAVSAVFWDRLRVAAFS